MKLRYKGSAVVAVLAAVCTVIPAHASKVNMLGYYSICSAVPTSTLICLVVAIAIVLIGDRYATRGVEG